MTTAIQKRIYYIDGEYQWNVQYHRAGDMIASSAWFGTEEEADEFVASITRGKGQGV